MSLDDYYHILNKAETQILFSNLDDLFKRIFELELHNKKLRKKIRGKGHGKTNSGGGGSTNYNSDISLKLET